MIGRWPNEERTSCISSTCRGTPPTPPSSWKCSMQKRDSYHVWMGKSNKNYMQHWLFWVWPLQFASDSGWGAWKDWVKSARVPSIPRPPSASPHSHLPARLADAICSLPVCAFKLCSTFVHLFARVASVRIYACTSTTCWNGAGGKKCVHSVEKEKEGWNQYNSWFSLVLTYVKKSCLFSKGLVVIVISIKCLYIYFLRNSTNFRHPRSFEKFQVIGEKQLQ